MAQRCLSRVIHLKACKCHIVADNSIWLEEQSIFSKENLNLTN
uniref:Uncharacterized protein n=1 Tax=Nelumbo nucifera TaxID=4432 RepID=A0A822XVC6_NELNU|nr:TPA_asm: hypothetical protein HUJ06_025751 [Nelumbo nucifera]